MSRILSALALVGMVASIGDASTLRRLAEQDQAQHKPLTSSSDISQSKTLGAEEQKPSSATSDMSQTKGTDEATLSKASDFFKSKFDDNQDNTVTWSELTRAFCTMYDCAQLQEAEAHQRWLQEQQQPMMQGGDHQQVLSELKPQIEQIKQILLQNYDLNGDNKLQLNELLAMLMPQLSERLQQGGEQQTGAEQEQMDSNYRRFLAEQEQVMAAQQGESLAALKSNPFAAKLDQLSAQDKQTLAQVNDFLRSKFDVNQNNVVTWDELTRAFCSDYDCAQLLQQGEQAQGGSDEATMAAEEEMHRFLAEQDQAMIMSMQQSPFLAKMDSLNEQQKAQLAQAKDFLVSKFEGNDNDVLEWDELAHLLCATHDCKQLAEAMQQQQQGGQQGSMSEGASSAEAGGKARKLWYGGLGYRRFGFGGLGYGGRYRGFGGLGYGGLYRGFGGLGYGGLYRPFGLGYGGLYRPFGWGGLGYRGLGYGSLYRPFGFYGGLSPFGLGGYSYSTFW